MDPILDAMVIEASDLWFTYPDGTEALKGVSFQIREGESVAIVGNNGAGKSTLLQHFNGFFRATRGELRVEGQCLTQDRLDWVRRVVGMVFQDPDDQLFMPTVFEDVAFGPLNFGKSTEEVQRCVTDALERVGMLHLRDRSPHRLSAGEKRAVALATVLVMTPRVLVLDEPTSNLDSRGRRRLIELLRTLDQTKILVTHDLEMVMEICPRMILLNEGKVVADGQTVDLLNNAAWLRFNELEWSRACCCSREK